jgi:cobalamin-dependent methionine synthase I
VLGVIGPETGKRPSWGYPACPDLEQPDLVDRLLDATYYTLAQR